MLDIENVKLNIWVWCKAFCQKIVQTDVGLGYVMREQEKHFSLSWPRGEHVELFDLLLLQRL